MHVFQTVYRTACDDVSTAFPPALRSSAWMPQIPGALPPFNWFTTACVSTDKKVVLTCPFALHSENLVVGAMVYLFIPSCVQVGFFVFYLPYLSGLMCQINPWIVSTPCLINFHKPFIVIRKVFPFASHAFHRQVRLWFGWYLWNNDCNTERINLSTVLESAETFIRPPAQSFRINGPSHLTIFYLFIKETVYSSWSHHLFHIAV